MGGLQSAKIIQARSLTSLLTRFYIPPKLFGLSLTTMRLSVEEEMIMNIKSLVPWGRERRNVPVRREQDNPFYSLQRSINQVFDNFLFEGFGQSPFGVYASFSPRLDASETDKEFRVTAELPGMDQNEWKSRSTIQVRSQTQ
jgi:hypothetical protein